MSDQAVKTFTTTARKADNEAQVVTFNLDGTEFTATRPDATQFVLLSAYGSEDFGASVREMGHFIDGCLPRNQRGIIARRLRDVDDPFGIEDLTAIFRFLLEEFTGRPTGSSTD